MSHGYHRKLKPFVDLEHHQNVMSCSLSHWQQSLWLKPIHDFFSQTDQQPDKRWLSHDLLTKSSWMIT